ncbi:MAG: histidine--tRNA ligase [Planctomycetaceae bacterium]|nr:histidine--tRNA ligase [Planctomycetaceae bacterium]
MIQPRTLKGFRDFLPEAMIPREKLVATAQQVYRSFGYSPIDTPILEYLEILQGKGGDESDRLMYHFEDHGGRAVGMRFDLTVPLARFAAQHAAELGMPFKRYHIAKVWRGENTHRGRYREFMQCDFDTIGTESIAADIETVLVVHELMQAIGLSGFQIRFNNRKVLSGLLAKLGLADQSTAVLRALDKLAKIGPDKVAMEMVAVAGASESQAKEVLALAEINGTNDEILLQLAKLVEGSEEGEAGVAALRDVTTGALAAGVSADRLSIDVSIARGLDYYTGTVIETFLNQLPEIGSVCSGGRYDDLASVYTKQRLPGIGASLGLDRLLAAMEELGLIERINTPAPIFIPFFDATRLHDYLALATQLRSAGLGVEVYAEAKKLGQQLKYADRRGFRLAIIAGDRELDSQTCQVKDLKDGSTIELSTSDPNWVDQIKLRLKK